MNGLATPWTDEQCFIMLIPFSHLRTYCFVANILGWICPCCGMPNPVHPRGLPWSGLPAPLPRTIQMAIASFVGDLGARDPIGFVGAPNPIPYRAAVLLPTRFPISRFAMEYFIQLPLAGIAWTQADVNRVVQCFVEARRI